MEWVLQISDYLIFSGLCVGGFGLSWWFLAGWRALRLYREKHRFTDFDGLIGTPFEPTVTVVVNGCGVKQLHVNDVNDKLLLSYVRCDLVVVVDSERSSGFSELLRAYGLLSDRYVPNGSLSIQEPKMRWKRSEDSEVSAGYGHSETSARSIFAGIYRRRDNAFRNLIVVDTHGLTRGDAYNCGINFSGSDYVLCVDLQDRLRHDTLIRLVKPVLEYPQGEVIAVSGGVLPQGIYRKEEVGLCASIFLKRLRWLELIRYTVSPGFLFRAPIFRSLVLLRRDAVFQTAGYASGDYGCNDRLLFRLKNAFSMQEFSPRILRVPEVLLRIRGNVSVSQMASEVRGAAGALRGILRDNGAAFFRHKTGRFGFFLLPFWMLIQYFVPALVVFCTVLLLVFSISAVQNLAYLGWFLLCVYLLSVCFWFGNVIFYGLFLQEKGLFKLLLFSFVQPFIRLVLGFYARFRRDVQEQRLEKAPKKG